MERTQIEQNLDKSDRKLSENINEGLQAYKIFTFIQLYVLYDLFSEIFEIFRYPQAFFIMHGIFRYSRYCFHFSSFQCLHIS